MLILLRKFLTTLFVLLPVAAVALQACTSAPLHAGPEPSAVSDSVAFAGDAESNCMAETLHWCATRKNGFTLTCVNRVLWLADLTEYVFCEAETDRQSCVFDGEGHRYPYGKCVSACHDAEEHYFETFDDLRTAAAAVLCNGP